MGRYSKIFDKIYISGWLADKFFEIYAIFNVVRQFGCRGNFAGLNSLSGLPKNVFFTAVAKVAVKSRMKSTSRRVVS
jgi:hypothetical protein